MYLEIPKTKNTPYIKVIGVGGAGTNAVNYMFEKGIKDVEFLVTNMDDQSLQMSPVPNKLTLGKDGLGAGTNPEMAKQATEEKKEEIKKIFGENTKMIFIAAGMGGGTGTGASPVIAKIAKEMQILTVAIVSSPQKSEGEKIGKNAVDGITALQEVCDAIIIVENEKILKEYPGIGGIRSAYNKANDILANAAKGIAEIITIPGYKNVDFRDVYNTLEKSGTTLIGSGKENGKDRCLKAIEQIISCPLLKNISMEGAKKVLINVGHGTKPEWEVTPEENEKIQKFIQDKCGQTPDMKIGFYEDASITDDSLSIFIIVTAFAKQTPIESPYRHFTLTEQPKNKNEAEKRVFVGSNQKNIIPLDEEIENTLFSADSTNKNKLYQNKPKVNFIAKEEKSLKPETYKEEQERKRKEREKQYENKPAEPLDQPTIESFQNRPSYEREKISLEPTHNTFQNKNSPYSVGDTFTKNENSTSNIFLHPGVD
ncbi:MAG: cell division protein FtsZ [Chitinophagaceae bacterium]|nr:cell division protein FtsZ [Chitinophagaceae bacterium]